MMSILKSLFVIVAVAAVAGGATYSYFDSKAEVNGVTFSTGTLHITNTSEDWMQPVVFSNLKPGDVVRKWVRIENDGTLDATLTVSANTVVDPKHFLDQVAGWSYGTIANTSDDPNGEQTGYNDHFLNLFGGSGVTLLSSKNPVLKPGQHTTTQVQFVVPTTLGNDFQGATATLNLVYHAEQVH